MKKFREISNKRFAKFAVEKYGNNLNEALFGKEYGILEKINPYRHIKKEEGEGKTKPRQTKLESKPKDGSLIEKLSISEKDSKERSDILNKIDEIINEFTNQFSEELRPYIVEAITSHPAYIFNGIKDLIKGRENEIKNRQLLLAAILKVISDSNESLSKVLKEKFDYAIRTLMEDTNFLATSLFERFLSGIKDSINNLSEYGSDQSDKDLLKALQSIVNIVEKTLAAEENIEENKSWRKKAKEFWTNLFNIGKKKNKPSEEDPPGNPKEETFESGTLDGLPNDPNDPRHRDPDDPGNVSSDGSPQPPNPGNTENKPPQETTKPTESTNPTDNNPNETSNNTPESNNQDLNGKKISKQVSEIIDLISIWDKAIANKRDILQALTVLIERLSRDDITKDIIKELKEAIKEYNPESENLKAELESLLAEIWEELDQKENNNVNNQNKNDDLNKEDVDNSHRTDKELRTTHTEWKLDELLKGKLSPYIDPISNFLREQGAFEFIKSGKLAKLIKNNPNLEVKLVYLGKTRNEAGEILTGTAFFVIEHKDGKLELNGKKYQVLGNAFINSDSGKFGKEYQRALNYNANLDIIIAGDIRVDSIQIGRKIHTEDKRYIPLTLEWFFQGKTPNKTQQQEIVFAVYKDKQGNYSIIGNTQGQEIVNVHEPSPGTVWTLTREADGRYYQRAVYVSSLTEVLQENKNSKVVKDIKGLLTILLDPKNSAISKIQARTKLGKILYLTSENQIYFHTNGINIGTSIGIINVDDALQVLSRLGVRFQVSSNITHPEIIDYIISGIFKIDLKQPHSEGASVNFRVENRGNHIPAAPRSAPPVSTKTTKMIPVRGTHMELKIDQNGNIVSVLNRKTSEIITDLNNKISLDTIARYYHHSINHIPVKTATDPYGVTYEIYNVQGVDVAVVKDTNEVIVYINHEDVSSKKEIIDNILKKNEEERKKHRDVEDLTSGARRLTGGNPIVDNPTQGPTANTENQQQNPKNNSSEKSDKPKKPGRTFTRGSSTKPTSKDLVDGGVKVAVSDVSSLIKSLEDLGIFSKEGILKKFEEALGIKIDKLPEEKRLFNIVKTLNEKLNNHQGAIRWKYIQDKTTEIISESEVEVIEEKFENLTNSFNHIGC